MPDRAAVLFLLVNSQIQSKGQGSVGFSSRCPVAVDHKSTLQCVSAPPSPHARLQRSDDGTAMIWNTKTRKLTALRGHSGSVTSVTFRPLNGKRLATGSGDSTSKILEHGNWPRTDDLARTLRFGQVRGFQPRWQAASRNRLRRRDSSNLRTRDSRPVAAGALARATRPLSSDECLQYFHSHRCPTLP